MEYQYSVHVVLLLLLPMPEVLARARGGGGRVRKWVKEERMVATPPAVTLDRDQQEGQGGRRGGREGEDLLQKKFWISGRRAETPGKKKEATVG